MDITLAQYMKDTNENNVSIKAIINNVETYIPLDPANQHYEEIMRQVEAGELTIADAD